MKPSEVIMERGWIQNSLSRPEGVCILQSICLALHGDESCKDQQCEKARVPFQRAVKNRDIIAWNDKPGRTVEQVIALLREFETEFESEEVRQLEPAAVA